MRVKARQGVRRHNVTRIPPILGPLSSVSFARFPVQLHRKMARMDEPLKRKRSASLWNWFDKIRWDHHHQRRRDKSKPGHPNRQVSTDLDFNLSCLTLDESPIKRRWIPKRMTRPVSCCILTSMEAEGAQKNRGYFETHFPSDPIPQRVKAAGGSIQTLVSLDNTIDRQVHMMNYIAIAYVVRKIDPECLFTSTCCRWTINFI